MAANEVNGIRLPGTQTIYKVNYEALANKPAIAGTQLVGNKTFDELGITAEGIGVGCAGAYDVLMLFSENGG